MKLEDNNQEKTFSFSADWLFSSSSGSNSSLTSSPSCWYSSALCWCTLSSTSHRCSSPCKASKGSCHRVNCGLFSLLSSFSYTLSLSVKSFQVLVYTLLLLFIPLLMSLLLSTQLLQSTISNLVQSLLTLFSCHCISSLIDRFTVCLSLV